MDFIQARNKIISLWRSGGLAYEKVNRGEYKQMYYAVRSHLKGGSRNWQMALGNFLINGALSYDRFAGLRPNVVNQMHYDMFCHFLNTLQKLDGNLMDRTTFFHLEKIKWDIYRECSLQPHGERQEEFLEQCKKKVLGISIPHGNDNSTHYYKETSRSPFGTY